MNERQLQASLPTWVPRLGVAVWVTGPDGNIVYINERATKLLDTSASSAVGKPCHTVVGGRDEHGQPWCSANCSVRQGLSEQEEIEPYTMRLGSQEEGDERWVQLLVIPYRPGGIGEVHVAHCAFSVDKSHMIESYLDRVAARTPVNSRHAFDPERARLSKRELEVLELLSEDENLYSIAEKLNVSYYTVRNHVQHVLGKMGVHSTLEAVAQYLLWKASGQNGE